MKKLKHIKLFESKDGEIDINILKNALDDAFAILETQVPQTMKKSKTISIQNVKPSQLMSFMSSNDIPRDAHFSRTDDDIVLEWFVDIPTTEDYKLKFKNLRFHDIAFKTVYESLITSGHKRISEYDRHRISYRNNRVVLFDNKTIYEMYMDKEFDKLLEYYSMYYRKI